MIKRMPPILSHAAVGKAKELAYRQVAERCKVDLFFLNRYILNVDIQDEFVHGALCAATRPLLYWRDKAYARSFEFPSDYGRTEAQGLPDASEKAEFFERVRKFIPGEGELDKVFDSSLHQLLALLPRGVLKTTEITIGFVLQWFLVYPESRVLIDSETSTNSGGFLAEIKGHLEGNDAYREIFRACHGVYPDANAKDKNTRWNTSAVDLACRTKPRKEPSIDTGGVDTTKNSRHYDLIIFDDLHSEINTQTKEQIEKVKTHWKLAYSLLDPGCPVIVIGTRWDFDDLYQMIIDEHRDKFNIIARSAIGVDGELLYAAKLDRAFLDNKRELQGSYIFSCQYQNEPVDADTAKFKREYFQYRSWKEVDGIPINWYLTIDPGGAGKSIILAFKTKMKELGIWLPIQYIEHRVTAKTTRIESLAPKYEFRHVFHIRECPQIRELEDELLHFPKAKNDDVSDALATVLEIATPPLNTPRQREHDEKRRSLFKTLNTARSPMIGY
jgi:predicted phage terminase large subunit-like protein